MDIIVTGSIAYDYLMFFPGKFADMLLLDHLNRISVSFLVENMTKHYGGNGGNIAYTMGLLGQRPKLFGTVGQDFAPYAEWLSRVGVDLSTVQHIHDVYMASFFANTDIDNNQLGSFYSGAMSYAKNFRIADASPTVPDLVVISPNDPQAMRQYCAECRERSIKFVYDPSQQVARLNGEELLESMAGAYMMVVNDYEQMIISQKTGYSLEQLRSMIEVLIVTHGKDGSAIYVGDEYIRVPVFETNQIKEPTGVGDAYRAGLVTGLALGFPLRLCGEMGALCATYTLEQVGTQNHHFTPAEFVARFRTAFDDGGLLDHWVS
ncbi:MAG: carbohydrate kinase family protein [bacterium]|nr:carbohydrate kinase family protein [bacterium]